MRDRPHASNAEDPGSYLLIDGRTAERLDPSVRLRDHGAIAVRGFAVPIRVYEPLAGASRN